MVRSQLNLDVALDVAAVWARRVAVKLTGAVKASPVRSAVRRRQATKAEIVRFMQGAGGHSPAVALTSRASIAWALQLTVAELQPLLDELVAEGKIFRCEPPVPPDCYSLAEWRPDWGLPARS